MEKQHEKPTFIKIYSVEEKTSYFIEIKQNEKPTCL